MCRGNNEKRKRQMTEGIELPNQEKIRTLGEKETYLGILEADYMKQLEMKETILKEDLWKTKRKLLETKLYCGNKYLGCLSCKKLRTILEADEERTSTNAPENKKTHVDA